MKVDFIRIHSGFANIPDSVVIIPPDQDSFQTDSPTDCYSCDLPAGFEFSEGAFGETTLCYNGREVSADVIDKGGASYIYLYDGTSPFAIYKAKV